jgi:hypothetical protein
MFEVSFSINFLIHKSLVGEERIILDRKVLFDLIEIDVVFLEGEGIELLLREGLFLKWLG